MKVVKSINAAQHFPRLCVALGNFDGVHLGHQKLISTVVEEAKKIHGTPAVLTFHPHPSKVILANNRTTKALILDDRKIELFKEHKIKVVIQLPFTKEFAAIPAKEFVMELAEKLDLVQLVVGFNYSFGRDGAGDWKLLQELSNSYGFSLQIIPPVKIEHKLISSTAVRTALTSGDVRLANRLLGRPPILEGKIVEGNRIGRSLGFPTANLDIDEDILMPQNGVYLTKVTINHRNYFGLLNIGTRPTLTKTPRAVAEVHILDYRQDVYGEHIEVYLLEKLRMEKKFNSKEELITQIQDDLENALKIIKHKYQKTSNNLL